MNRSSVWLAIMLVSLFILFPLVSSSDGNADFQQDLASGFPAHTIQWFPHSPNALSVAPIPPRIWPPMSKTVDARYYLLPLFALFLRKWLYGKSAATVKRPMKTKRFAFQGYFDHPHHAPPCFAGS
jgi:hypothetical protein